MKPFPLIWIPLLPLLGAALLLLIGRKLPRRAVYVVGCGTVLLALLISVVAVFRDLWPLWAAVSHSGVHGGEGAHAAPPRLVQDCFEWIVTADWQLRFGLMCDTLTGVMLLVITFVGFLIHVYSTGYMAHDPGYARFFGYLNLFTGAMLVLVLGDSLPVLFVGWEGVGLCSYLLIGFWYDKEGTQRLGIANASAGRKAFIVNRIGDFSFLLGMFLLFATTHTFSFAEMSTQTAALLTPFRPLGLGTFTVAGVAGLLLFIGATGKSAQIPLFVWLPDAMAGPTPVSALIHAATMVTAGIYMVARLNFVYMLTPAVMGLVALVGALTALFAATIGFAQNDIKKVLAYSTVSQLGYMFMGVGVGAFSAGIFHVFTHAFFKACLFLGAGAVIHALHEEQDIRRMGGLTEKLSVVRWTFLVSTLAIAGILPLSGFFSKDEILWSVVSMQNPAWPSAFPYVLYVIGLAGAFCTAFYMFRLYSLTFLGPSRLSPAEQHKIHAPGPAMSLPLVVLASGAAVLGVLGLPGLFGEHANFFHSWLTPTVGAGATIAERLDLARVMPSERAHSHALEALLMALSLAVAVLSSWVGWRMYRGGPNAWAGGFAERHPLFYGLIADKYRIDELYDLTIVRPFRRFCWAAFKLADQALIDVFGVQGAAWVVDRAGRVARSLQNGNVQQYITALLIGLAVLVWVAAKGGVQ